MSGQPTTTANPQTTWGNNDARNRVRPGGDLGNRQYWYQTDVQTGAISVYRHTPGPEFPLGDGGSVDTRIGTIPPGGTFNALSRDDGTPLATGAELVHYGDTTNRNAAITNAQRVATRDWDGRTQPSPSNSIQRNGVASPNPTGGTANNNAPGGGNNNTQGNDDAGNGGNNNLGQRVAALSGNASASVLQSNTSLGAGQVIIYPVTLRSSAGGQGQDYIKLQMLEYAPKGMGDFSGGNLSGSGPRPKNRKGLGSAILPIPGGIADNNNVSWGGDTMDPVAQAFASVAFATIMQGVEAGGAKAQTVMDAAQKSSGATKTALGTAIAGAATKTGAQVLKRTSGAIINPNMELLFNNPSLRQFNFTWKLAPRSRDEARAVIQIIRFFKQGMAPIREAPNLFLKSPNTWKLTYHHRFDEHKFLNRFKECALLNCGVQYTPDGNYATYEDGVMTAYQMTLAFQELEPVYSDDYKEVPATEIGF